jgi:hypothetical protein
MSNQSYLSVWCKGFGEENMLEQFQKFLGTVPYSTSRPGFSYLTIHAVSAAETPVMEHDLRNTPLDAEGIVELSREGLHADSAFDVRCNCDLWTYEPEGEKWVRGPEPVEISCLGPEYDDEFWRDNGNFQVNFGFEHIFTGHAGLLGMRQAQRAAESPEEARFMEIMAWPENLQIYRDKTKENIKLLFDWVRKIEKALPVERVQLWSEGEENFEARLEEILTAR